MRNWEMFPGWFSLTRDAAHFSVLGLVKQQRQSSDRPSPICPHLLQPSCSSTKQEGEAAIGSIRTASPARVALCSHRLTRGDHEKTQLRKRSLSSQQFKGVMMALSFFTSGTWDAFCGTQHCWTPRCSVPGGAHPIMNLGMCKFKPSLS